MLWKCCCTLLLIMTGLVTSSSQINNDYDGGVRKTAPQSIRTPRFVQPSGIFGFFTTLRNIKGLYDQQYNETASALQRVMAIVSDGFSDVPTTKRSQSLEEVTTNGSNDTDITTTTPKYRISRQELGYILGRNYRGLQKLLRLELADAAKQSRVSIKEYRRDWGRALTQYTVTKSPNSIT